MRTADLVVVGAGVAGLSAARTYADNCPNRSLLVFEASATPGGHVATTTTDGYTVEHGATAIVLAQPDVLDLIERLDLTGRLQVAAQVAHTTALWIDGQLSQVPRTPRRALDSRILSRRGLARAAAEPLFGRRPQGSDTSIYEMAQRRFGSEFARVAATAGVQGVTAGDAESASLSALLPRLADLDRNTGRMGMLGAAVRLWAKTRQARSSQPRRPSTFRDGGLSVLVQALASSLGSRLELGCGVLSVKATDDGRWIVQSERGEPVIAGDLVLAVPARQAAVLLREHAPVAAGRLATIDYADLRVVGLGYRREAFPVVPRGFGFLTTPAERLGVIGATISSNAFPAQAPPGHILIRAFAGGFAHPNYINQPTDIAVKVAHDAMCRVFDIGEEPRHAWDLPSPQSIPQYRVGHLDLIAAIENDLSRLGGPHLIGSSYRGLGLTDVISTAVRLGRTLASTQRTAEPRMLPQQVMAR